MIDAKRIAAGVVLGTGILLLATVAFASSGAWYWSRFAVPPAPAGYLEVGTEAGVVIVRYEGLPELVEPPDGLAAAAPCEFSINPQVARWLAARLLVIADEAEQTPTEGG